MGAPWNRRRRLLAGAVGGALFGVLALAEAYGDPRGDDGRAAVVGLRLVLSLCFPLAARYPITAMSVAMLSFPYAMLIGAKGVGGAQLIAELVLVAHAAYRAEPRRSLAASVCAAVVPAVALVWGGEGLWEFVFFGTLVSAAWSLGALLRREQSRSRQLAALAAELAAEREARARAAVAEERARISRELHDAVAHTVSVMTMQAGVVRRRLADRPVERDALVQVEQLGRRSVTELRRVVGLLRPDDADGLAPPPSLRRVDDLVMEVRSAGLQVTSTVSGTPTLLPLGVDMSAYRIVQEALTNVLRHAVAAVATVTVAYEPDSVSVRVLDDGRGAAAPGPGPDGGHGLVGMRERVGMFGGELRAGPCAEGGFEVYARFPLGEGMR
ncbi:sensor histidine kinase [Nonomuraea africana]|uniref:histidine kinase n=1 Tax=Nonomuraea africana TaxID=46171 RepID=A0ABR9KSF3_9ACTN|nr:histidine kinase [Nonomuraea africana]MBE1564955.1 signal transduction histidine kinase [Nonomuraea africana]